MSEHTRSQNANTNYPMPRLCKQIFGFLNHHKILAFVIENNSLKLLWKNEQVTKEPLLFEAAVRKLYSQEKCDSKYPLKSEAGFLTFKNLKQDSSLAVYLFQELTHLKDTSLCLILNVGQCIQQIEHLQYIKEYCVGLISKKQYESLTSKQKKVLQLILNGKSRKEIASDLDLSVYTIQDHYQALFKKFGCQTVSQLRYISKSIAVLKNVPQN